MRAVATAVRYCPPMLFVANVKTSTPGTTILDTDPIVRTSEASQPVPSHRFPRQPPEVPNTPPGVVPRLQSTWPRVTGTRAHAVQPSEALNGTSTSAAASTRFQGSREEEMMVTSMCKMLLTRARASQQVLLRVDKHSVHVVGAEDTEFCYDWPPSWVEFFVTVEGFGGRCKVLERVIQGIR